MKRRKTINSLSLSTVEDYFCISKGASRRAWKIRILFESHFPTPSLKPPPAIGKVPRVSKEEGASAGAVALGPEPSARAGLLPQLLPRPGCAGGYSGHKHRPGLLASKLPRELETGRGQSAHSASRPAWPGRHG